MYDQATGTYSTGSYPERYMSLEGNDLHVAINNQVDQLEYFVPSNLRAASDGSSNLSFSVNDLRLAVTTQAYYEALARSGSRYDEQILQFFGVRSPDARLQNPEYLGGNRIQLNVHEELINVALMLNPDTNVGTVQPYHSANASQSKQPVVVAVPTTVKTAQAAQIANAAAAAFTSDVFRGNPSGDFVQTAISQSATPSGQPSTAVADAVVSNLVRPVASSAASAAENAANFIRSATGESSSAGTGSGLERYMSLEGNDLHVAINNQVDQLEYFVPSNLRAASDGSSNLSFSVNDLRLAVTTQAYYEALARSGSRYDEQILQFFGVRSPDARLQNPEYLGGNRIQLNVHEELINVALMLNPDTNVGTVQPYHSANASQSKQPVVVAVPTTVKTAQAAQIANAAAAAFTSDVFRGNPSGDFVQTAISQSATPSGQPSTAVADAVVSNLVRPVASSAASAAENAANFIRSATGESSSAGTGSGLERYMSLEGNDLHVAINNQVDQLEYFVPSNLRAASDGSSNLSFSVNDLRLAVTTQAYYEALARSGSRYDEQILQFFGVRSPDARLQNPEYLGGNRIQLNVHEELINVALMLNPDTNVGTVQPYHSANASQSKQPVVVAVPTTVKTAQAAQIANAAAAAFTSDVFRGNPSGDFVQTAISQSATPSGQPSTAVADAVVSNLVRPVASSAASAAENAANFIRSATGESSSAGTGSGLERYMSLEGNDLHVAINNQVDQLEYFVPSNLRAASDGSSNLSFSVNDLRLAVTTQAYYEALARSGSRYDEQILQFFGVRSPDARLQNPEYLGGNRIQLNVHEELINVALMLNPDTNVGTVQPYHSANASQSKQPVVVAVPTTVKTTQAAQIANAAAAAFTSDVFRGNPSGDFVQTAISQSATPSGQPSTAVADAVVSNLVRPVASSAASAAENAANFIRSATGESSSAGTGSGL
ncbi:unnamed protein product, partial [Cylicocyclus nassatus]